MKKNEENQRKTPSVYFCKEKERERGREKYEGREKKGNHKISGLVSPVCFVYAIYIPCRLIRLQDGIMRENCCGSWSNTSIAEEKEFVGLHFLEKNLVFVFSHKGKGSKKKGCKRKKILWCILYIHPIIFPTSFGALCECSSV